MKRYSSYRVKEATLVFVLLIGGLLCGCTTPAAKPAPATETAAPTAEIPSTEIFPTEIFPYELENILITASLIGEPWKQTLPPDDALRNWIIDYVAQAQPADFDAHNKQDEIEYRGNAKIHFSDAVLSYVVWFDEETELFDSALLDENNQCWKQPHQTEYPLMFEIKNVQGELIFSLLPKGKLLQAYSWNNRADGSNTDVELRYTGNLELWVDDVQHIIQKDYSKYGYEGLPYVGIEEPRPRLLHVMGKDMGAAKHMLLLSHQTESLGIGTLESWSLYRVEGKTLQELTIAPGHEEDLSTTVVLRGEEIFLLFPKLEQELPLEPIDFFPYEYATLEGAIEYVKKAQQEEKLAELFSLWTSVGYIDYVDYWSDRGPSMNQITFWQSVNGPVHYYQGEIKVTYDITVEGLIPKRVQW